MNVKNEIRIFCPATVANISCGFDVLGLCLDTIGDEMIVRKIPQKEIRISKIVGQSLPLDPKKNVASVAALSIWEELGVPYGFEIEIYKHIKPGSGIGSSAASAAGAVSAINKIAGSPMTDIETVYHAMQGEVLASGSAHADNVAPAILGGFTLVRGYDPLDIVQIPAPEDLRVVILHPHIEIKTSEARDLLPSSIPLKHAITQWGNLAGLISALHTNDYKLLGRSLTDVVAEPLRSKLIPEFDKVKSAALEAGALGSGISGSGPSIFALCKGNEVANTVEKRMRAVYETTPYGFDTYVSPVSKTGTKELVTAQ